MVETANYLFPYLKHPPICLESIASSKRNSRFLAKSGLLEKHMIKGFLDGAKPEIFILLK